MDQKDKKLCGTFQYVRTFTHHTDHTGGDPGQFREGCHGKIGDTAWKGKADTAFTWSAKESKMLVEIATEKLPCALQK